MLIKDLESSKKISTRLGFGQALVKLGAVDKDIFVLSADLSESTGAGIFKRRFPDRYIECGVAEQNMIGVATGLALSGKIPIACTYGVFWLRAMDQVRISVCYNQANVKLVASHGGISVGADGATHQALEDIAMMRVLPNMTVVVPCDAQEAEKAIRALVKIKGPCYLRLSRPPTPQITTKKTPFKIGRAEIFKEGSEVTIVASGPILYNALVAAKNLEKQGISAEVINCHTIRPIDKTTLIKSVKKTKALVTCEDHQVFGGLGSAVLEATSENFPVSCQQVGIKDRFGQSGEADELAQEYGLTPDDIISATKKVLKIF